MYQVVLACNTAHSAAHRTTNDVNDTAYLETHSVAHHRLLLFDPIPYTFSPWTACSKQVVKRSLSNEFSQIQTSERCIHFPRLSLVATPVWK